MRLGLDIRHVEPEGQIALAAEADRLGLWAVLVGGSAGTEATEAAAVAVATEHIHVAVDYGRDPDGPTEHPTVLAEEIAVLDHLSRRRALAVIGANPELVDHVDRLLAGHIVDGFALTPPPAQTRVPVWAAGEIAHASLTGRLDADRATIDAHRDRGTTHLFVVWPADLAVLARHLVTRAAAPAFPQIVAEMADVVDPPP